MRRFHFGSVFAAGAIIAGALMVAAAPAHDAAPMADKTTDAVGSPQNVTFYGPSQPFGNGTIKTYAVVDKSGNPTEVGLRLSESALQGLPDENTDLRLALPDQAKMTVFDHVMANWNPHGHRPAMLFDKPHFDFHFYMVDMATEQAVDPADPNFADRAANHPAPQYVPKDYAAMPDNAVPFMGVYWTDTTQQLIPGQYEFTSILLNGSWNGRYTFLEPMVSRDFLLTKPALTEEVKQPRAFQKTGFYPTIYQIRYDPAAKEYSIALCGLQNHTAS